MKISVTEPPSLLITGNFWNGATEQGLGQGFRRIGWGVQDVALTVFQDFGSNVVARAARRVLLDPLARRGYQDAVRTEMRTAKAQYFLTAKGAFLDSPLLDDIRAAGARTVNYYTDYHFSYSNVDVRTFGKYDFFITTKSFQLDRLRSLAPTAHVALVHHGYSPDVHQPYLRDLSEHDYESDVLYAGNHNTYKQVWLERLVSRAPAIKLKIVGHRWKAPCSKDSPLARYPLESGRVGYAYARAIQSTRINVALHGGPDPTGWQDLVSTRTFEIPACRGFMLHIDSEEVRSLYEVGAEIDVFSTVEELADKIRFYLARPELRARMIDRAFQRCVPAYSYDARAREIATIVQANGR